MRVGKFYFNAHHLNNVTLISKLVSKRPFSRLVMYERFFLPLIENIIQYLGKVSKVTLLILMKVFSENKQV